MNASPGAGLEALRQQWLLRALRAGAAPPDAPAWLAGPPLQQQRGLRVYQAHAAAHAERALAAAFPTVQQLLGQAAFAALAQAHWHAQPPVLGDLAAWGAGLPACIASDAQLAGEPYLADVARLDWALHQAQAAADDETPVTGLALLGSAEAAQLRLQLRAGHVVLVSAHPVHTLWVAHRSSASDRFAAARQALEAQRAEAVRVERQGLEAIATCIDATTAGFEQAVLQGRLLADALTAAGASFNFEIWLIDSLRRQSLAAVRLQLPASEPQT